MLNTVATLLKSKTKQYASIDDYFKHIVKEVGYPPLHEFFSADIVMSDGRKLHVDVLDFSKNVPTILFIPGTAIYSLCYAEFLYKLSSQGFNIVGLDPRGHGRSEGTRGDYTIEDIMQDAEAAHDYAVKRFGDNVSIMGSSQGGIVSFYLAAKHNNRFVSAVCQNFADLTADESHKLVRYPNLIKYLKPTLLQFGKLMPDTPVPVSMYLDLEKIRVKYFGNAKKFMEQDPLALSHVSLKAVSSLATTKISKPIEEITTPIMVFQGDADSIFPVSYTQNIFDKITAKKRMEVFSGLNHAIMVEDPEIIIPPIVDWLKQVH